jgi:hypothetical protein
MKNQVPVYNEDNANRRRQSVYRASANCEIKNRDKRWRNTLPYRAPAEETNSLTELQLGGNKLPYRAPAVGTNYLTTTTPASGANSLTELQLVEQTPLQNFSRWNKLPYRAPASGIKLAKEFQLEI